MSARDKKILIGFIGVLVLILAFFFGHRPLTEKKEVLSAENATLRDQYADLSMKASNADMYSKEIKNMNSKMEEIYIHYPSFLQSENEIMDAVTLEDVTNTYISSLTIADPVAIEIPFEGETTTNEDGTVNEGGGVAPYQLYDVNNAISFETGYEGLKELLQLISTDAKRKSIGTLSATFNNATGEINGNMTYDSYFIYGLDKEYVAPTVPSMKHGVDNIFGTIEKVKQKEKEN